MKTLSKIFFLSACLVAISVQASEPENQRFKGSFFVGLGIPTFIGGRVLDGAGKAAMTVGGDTMLADTPHALYAEFISRSALTKLGTSLSVAGKACKGVGAGLIFIPMFINRQLIVNNVKNASQYRLKLEKKQDSGE